MSSGSTTGGRQRGLSASFGAPDRSRLHYLGLALMLVTILLVFGQTFGSMLDVWLHSDTFLHGILIFPISAYLIWLKRHDLRRIRPAGFWPGALGLLALSLVWWFAATLGVQAVQQLAATAMIVVAVITVMGPRFAGIIAFPLGYLFFAVPIGEVLVPYLMDYTAAFTVKALNMTGIPVFRDGRYFSIPAGNFEVARACSGIRYLLAALSLGTLFAYMIFKDARKRAFFVLFSIVMPIIANGLRAYGIVLIAQFVSLELATGVDHIVFGWIFFGVVIVLMFAVGNHFSDRDPDDPRPSADAEPPLSPGNERALSVIALLAASVACIAVGPLSAMYFARQSVAAQVVLSGLPASVPGWTGRAPEESEWQPLFHGADYEQHARYANGESLIDVSVVRYQGHQQGSELASSQNSLTRSRYWQLGNLQRVPVRLPEGDELTVNEVAMSRRGQVRMAWYWYEVDGEFAYSNLQIKLLEARSVVTGNQPLSSAVIISVDASGGVENSRIPLERFVQAAYGPIRDCMSGRGDAAECRSESR